MRDPAVKTTCPYCGVGCGISARKGAAEVEISGDSTHPANFGRLCSKGRALGETLNLDGRLLCPEVDGREVGWDEALNRVASGFRAVIDEHGPDAVAFYVSGQLLTEDYYVANKLMKGFIGSANIDTNSRLCMSSSVAGHKRAFGSDTVPGSYEDLEAADLVVLVGSNLAWCHPVLYQRLRAAKETDPRKRIVVIDPRRTATCDLADLHLPIAPGTDAMLFNGLLHYLSQVGAVDRQFMNAHTQGREAAFEAAADSAPSLEETADACALRREDLETFFRWFAAKDKTVTVYSQGVNQSSSGTDKVNAILNCHLATGRIGRPGAAPFSVTGQPNAMGGREVGGLANQLAAHMDFDPDDVARVARFWQSPKIAAAPGLKAVDLFQAVGEGRIKAIWIMGTNPAVSLPDSDRVRDALASCPFVVVSDCMRETDTVRFAHVKLPALAWGEKDGTVTNSERRISRQRAFLPRPGEAMADWWIVTEVARRLGYSEAFQYRGPAAIFREHAALSAFENHGQRDFDIGALADMTDDEFASLRPVQWPQPTIRQQDPARFFAEGRFYTPSGRAKLIPVVPKPPRHRSDSEYPMVLNTGRLRDHWHTLTRTGKSPTLSAHVSEPTVEMQPEDARRIGLQTGDLARVRSARGELIARVRAVSSQRLGEVFVPMHWTDHFCSRGRVGALIDPTTDPMSGQPESKHTPVRLERYPIAWRGVLLTRDEVKPPAFASHWTAVRGKEHWRLELVGQGDPFEVFEETRRMLAPDGTDWLELCDTGLGVWRGAALTDQRLSACVFLSRNASLPSRSWVGDYFSKTSVPHEQRLAVLAGYAGDERAESGPTVCACFGVGEDAIVCAIRDRGIVTAEGVGRSIRAGTGCGSCVPEIKELIARNSLAKNAA